MAAIAGNIGKSGFPQEAADVAKTTEQKRDEQSAAKSVLSKVLVP